MKKIIKFVVIAIIVIGIGGALLGGGEEESEPTKKEDKTEEQVKITYTEYSVNEMVADLEGNALNASDKYKDQYVKITGELVNIDSDGSYISIGRTDGEFSMYDVQCSIESDEQLDKVKKMSIGDTVTIKGKVTDVGEVLGYSLDIDEIK